jgi:Putative MetA-pathway of phenol degradation
MTNDPLRMRGIRCTLIAGVGAIFGSGLATAGPPLFTDDPHTVGAGSVEAILAVELLDQSGVTLIDVPMMDLTVGIIDLLDLTLVGAPQLHVDDGLESTSGYIEAGLKWQPVKTSRWNASFSPTIVLTDDDESNAGLLMPIQLEWTEGSVRVGLDVGYTAIEDAPDEWHASASTSWSTTPNLWLLAELWSTGLAGERAGDLGMGLGFEWDTPLGMELLVSAGSGLDSWTNDRVEWHSYVGLRWAFDAW